LGPGKPAELPPRSFPTVPGGKGNAATVDIAHEALHPWTMAAKDHFTGIAPEFREIYKQLGWRQPSQFHISRFKFSRRA
jgi:hypothetical protein